MILSVEWEDRILEYDPDAIDVMQARQIKQLIGGGIRTFEKGIDDGDPDCLQALMWIIKCQAGERVPMKTLNFSISEFYRAIYEASQRALIERMEQDRKAALLDGEAEGDAVDPTVTAPSGTQPETLIPPPTPTSTTTEEDTSSFSPTSAI